MKWLQDNTLGWILAAFIGVLVLFALGMSIVWNLPVSVETSSAGSALVEDDDTNMTSRQIGALREYLVINEKPVFNESRQPVTEELEEEPEVEDDVIEVKDAPDVKLTGIVMTSSKKIVSLTPTDTNIDTVMALEGDSLTGEFVGWQVAEINPRTVVLKSRDGQSLELDLQVHDVAIKEPPPPVAPAPSAASSGAGAGSEEDEPLSRAEQIRQRIAERREELRLEQELRKAEDGIPAKRKTSDYQSAIRSMMKKNIKDSDSNDEKDK